MIMEQKNLLDIVTEIKEICNQPLGMQVKIVALKIAGYKDVSYKYVNHGRFPNYANTIFQVKHLRKKKVFRIQISDTEIEKDYPAAWCVDIPEENVIYEPELSVVLKTNVSLGGLEKNNRKYKY